MSRKLGFLLAIALALCVGACGGGGEQCEAGTQGCPCLADGTCTTPDMICRAGRCESRLLPPENPICYSPCRSDLIRDDGTVVACTDEGLMEACLGGTVCVDGSCVPPGSGLTSLRAACADDAGCPDFQTCIAGNCYSTCAMDDDCDADHRCHRHVCRIPCSMESNPPCQGSDRVCLPSDDGVNGFCMPSHRVPGGDLVIAGSFVVSRRSLGFSNASVGASFFIINDHPLPQDYTVRKVRHTEYLPDGSLNIVEQAPATLSWLRLGRAGQMSAEAEVSVHVEEFSEVEVFVDGAGDSGMASWRGVLEVVHPEMGVRQIDLEYASRPDGQWSGTMYYFGSFNPDGLDDWRNGNEDSAGVHNAFVLLWKDFRDGLLSREEFEAIAASTVNGSWKWESMKRYPDCSADNVACVPYGGSPGYLIYTQDTVQQSVPSGVIELPVVMNLKSDGSSPTLEGKIVSAQTLQYVGDPAVTLVLERPVDQCGNLCRMQKNAGAEAAANVLVGGRYRMPLLDPSQEKTECEAYAPDGGGGTFTWVKTPWLVPGFQNETAAEFDGRRYFYECRDTVLPFDDPERSVFNPAYAAANPIPNGQTLHRMIQVVDGALVDQDEIFILFKESFAPAPFTGSDFFGYGFMRLQRSPASLEPDDYLGSNTTDTRNPGTGPLEIGCSQELLAELAAKTGQTFDPTDPVSANDLADLVVFGQAASAGGATLVLDSPAEEEKVHYLCVETGLFDLSDMSAGDDPVEKFACPESSQVVYFTMEVKRQTDPTPCGAGCPAGYECQDDSCTKMCSVVADCGMGFAQCRVPEGADPSAQKYCYAAGTVGNLLRNHNCKNGFVPIEVETGETIETYSCTDMFMFGPEMCFLDVYRPTFFVGVETPGSCAGILGSCQGGTCTGWLGSYQAVSNAPYAIRAEPDLVWRCADTNRTYCSDDRSDLRAGKDFYSQGPGQPVLLNIQTAVNDAFRYKTRFRSRQGANVGFSPAICEPGSSLIPYCYDPASIEQITARVDCAVALYMAHNGDPAFTSAGALRDFLIANFGYGLETDGSNTWAVEGFERLRTELLIMLGDEAYTAAFQSRFDLAGSALNAFEGSLFEDGGMDLSGGAGFEMANLYLAVQYYQLALDRFYTLNPVVWDSLPLIPLNRGFITQRTVSAYFDRLIRASTQKARAWSEIARRYQAFNQFGELARRVVERAYTATYLESVILKQMMIELKDLVALSERPQIAQRVELAQLGYSSALLQMRDVYQSISDSTTIFGLAPEYIPFPAMDPYDTNAFEKVLAVAKEKVSIAADKEDAALAVTRDFNTDAAAFQSELVSIRNNYESRLGEICGTFAGSDGRIYPAITKYAEWDVELSRYPGDICGRVDNGALHDAMAAVDQASLDLRQAGMAVDDLVAEVQLERARVIEMCDEILQTASYVYTEQEEIDVLQESVRAAEMMKDRFARWETILTSSDNIYLWHMVAFEALIGACEVGIGVREYQIDKLERERTRWVTEQECEYAKVDSDAKTRTLLLRLDNLQVDYLKAAQEVGRAGSRVKTLANEARRLQDEQAESEQMAINVAAARNDPNFRIYKNDAILTADATFQDALKAVYKATKVYEYYTSQSYAHLIDLFLVRMVGSGDISLEGYLSNLEAAFFDFEEQYGNPDMRVLKISLRDDVFDIPRQDDYLPLSEARRNELFQQKLQEVSRLDERGYLVIPFATRLEDLSPVTHNHKIHHIESQIFGSDVGDALARLYLRQRGTGTVRGVDGEKKTYAFPEHTAVLNPIVGDYRGDREFMGDVFDGDVYVNRRLRDQPLVNSSWELVINKKDEKVNEDVRLESVQDICLYIFYNDFTEL